ncbi:MAG: hydrogenase iron-sulfur subunit [Magnetococcales bacterium]|nr:hydrogenase iron-sulfur subunit [Magnetococcales bacterium]MBF0155854.1 hydrogenase iron-sulfur subunit [Magnetococcales bacterium]
MEKKIGCYICKGCGIGDNLDVGALESVARKDQKIPVVRNHEFLCGSEGLELIRKDMESEGVNALVIAGCSPRAKVDEFRLGAALMDRVNLREQVLWVQPVAEGDDTAEEDRQMAAVDYLAMGCVKVKKMDAPIPFEDPGFSKDILVVGGGVAGLTAAKNIADTGYKVVLVEKSDDLGGMLSRMHKVSPTKPPYKDPEENPIAGLIAAVKGNGAIKIHTGATIKKTAGAPGLFDITIVKGGKESTERVGAIVVATGFGLYDAGKLPAQLGHGSSPDVITSLQFEEMAKAGKIVRPSDGQPAKRVAFSLCAGQRSTEHLEYCSGACCVYSLKQALYVKEQYADASTYLIYQEVRTPGQMEDFYRKVQDEGGVFIKGDVTQVAKGAGGGLSVEVNDKLLRGKEKLEVDLLVLAVGMTPSLDTVDPNKASPVGAGEFDYTKSVLNLDYRQGPSLPELKWGFPDSHFICFPYETRRTGIYVAGPARRPMGIAASVSDATGAALKAIQVVESVARGAAVHPRAGDLSYPSFRKEGCTQCKRCTEECPFGAINEDDKGNPLFNPTRCRRCGTCMGACPQKIISFANYSVDMIGSMLKEVEVPEEDEEKPRILIFACENDAYPAMDQMAQNRAKISPYVRVIPLRCMGSMNLVWVADAMSSGYDGVLLMGCRHGDQYQCHNVRGSALAEIRLSKVSETLDRLQLESARVRMVEVNIMDADKLPEVINGFVDDIMEFDPNPYKAF